MLFTFEVVEEMKCFEYIRSIGSMYLNTLKEVITFCNEVLAE